MVNPRYGTPSTLYCTAAPVSAGVMSICSVPLRSGSISAFCSASYAGRIGSSASGGGVTPPLDQICTWLGTSLSFSLRLKPASQVLNWSWRSPSPTFELRMPRYAPASTSMMNRKTGNAIT